MKHNFGYCGEDVADYVNKPIYAYAYKINDETLHVDLRQLPIKGMIIRNEKYNENTMRGYIFVPFKKNGKELMSKSKAVNISARKYADEYWEAIDGYNELVQDRINRLLSIAKEAKNDFITIEDVL